MTQITFHLAKKKKKIDIKMYARVKIPIFLRSFFASLCVVDGVMLSDFIYIARCDSIQYMMIIAAPWLFYHLRLLDYLFAWFLTFVFFCKFCFHLDISLYTTQLHKTKENIVEEITINENIPRMEIKNCSNFGCYCWCDLLTILIAQLIVKKVTCKWSVLARINPSSLGRTVYNEHPTFNFICKNINNSAKMINQFLCLFVLCVCVYLFADS